MSFVCIESHTSSQELKVPSGKWALVEEASKASLLSASFLFLSQEPRKHPLLLTKELSSVFSSSTTSSYYWVLLCLGFFLVVVARSLQDLSSPTGIKPRVMPWTPWNSLLCFITSLFSFYLINMLYFLGSFFSLWLWLISPYTCGFWYYPSLCVLHFLHC